MLKTKVLLPLLLLACALTLVGCAAWVGAADGSTSGTTGLAYELTSDGKGYVCTGIGNASTTDIVIPATYKGKPVTMITNGAFYNQTTLTSVTVSEGIRVIDMYAFRGCVRLERVKLPDSVFLVGNRAFDGCVSLRSVEIAGGQAADPDADLTEEEEMSRSLTIDASCFKGCTSLTSFTFSDENLIINKRTFDGCTALAEVTISAKIQAIDEGAFAGCTALKTIRYSGTQEQWEKLPAAPLWALDVTDCTVICTDAEVGLN